MKYVTVKLTRDQVYAIINGMTLIDDEPISSANNQFLLRIFNKLEKALAQAKS